MQREKQKQKLAGRRIDLDFIDKDQLEKAKAAMKREDRELKTQQETKEISRRDDVSQNNLVSTSTSLDSTCLKSSEDLMSGVYVNGDFVNIAQSSRHQNPHVGQTSHKCNLHVEALQDWCAINGLQTVHLLSVLAGYAQVLPT